MVKSILDRITASADIPELKLLSWEINVIGDYSFNASVLPGGKIMVHAGIFSTLKYDETLVAVVISHEIGHALARHTAEKLTASGTLSLARLLINWFCGLNVGYVTSILFDLPYSRAMESEADIIGLVLMHRAGYDVDRAHLIWEMPDEIPEFLSTHPSHVNRGQMLKKAAPIIKAGLPLETIYQ